MAIMKPIMLLAASGAALALVSGAQAATRDYDVASFDKVDAAAGVTVKITVGGAQSVAAETEGEDFDHLVVAVKDGWLRVKRDSNGLRWRRLPNYTVRVSMPALNASDVSSGADLSAEGIAAGAYRAEASSGGNATLAGTCDAITAEASSGGSLDAKGLECKTADVDVSSGGNARLFASESVNGDASSGGSAKIYGKPAQVSKDTSSGGSIHIAN